MSGYSFTQPIQSTVHTPVNTTAGGGIGPTQSDFANRAFSKEGPNWVTVAIVAIVAVIVAKWVLK